MNPEKREGRKLFLTAFALSLVLLALAMVSTVLAVQPVMPGSQEQEDGYVYRPPASDTLTMILAGLSGETPRDFLLIRYNPQYGQIPLALLPPQTKLAQGTLAEILSQNGAEALKRAVSEEFGIAVDRYAVMDANPFLRVAAKIGSVSYELPYEISYTKDGYPVRLAAGHQQLDGQDLLNLFAAPALRADPVEKSALLGNIVAEAINQNMSAASDKRASGIFRLAVNAVRTDVTSTDFELRRQSADFLAQMQRQYAGNLPVEGTWDGKDFVLAEAFSDLLRQYFQPV